MNNFHIARRTFEEDGAWHQTAGNTFATSAKTGFGVLKAVKRYSPRLSSYDIATAYGIQGGREFRVIICPKAREEKVLSQEHVYMREGEDPTPMEEEYMEVLERCKQIVEREDGLAWAAREVGR